MPTFAAGRVVAAVVVVAMAAGCGSTVAGSGVPVGLGTVSSASGAPARSSGVVPGPAATASSSARVGQTGSLPPVGASGSLPGTSAGMPSDAAVGPDRPAAPTGVTGRGWDAHHVYLGIDYVPPQSFDSAANAVGFKSLTVSDDQALAKSLIAEVNAAGGVLGRTVVPVFYDDSRSSDETAAAQASCTYFSQDRPVFAVVSLAPSWNCLAQHHIPSANAGNQELVDAPYLQALAPYFYAPTAFNMTDLTPLYLDRLTAEGYFGQRAKVGIIYDTGSDSQTEARDAKALQDQLTARHVDVAATFAVDDTTVGSTASGEANAVLPFRSKGVDHVISLDGSVAYFMIAAEQQHYRPRYAISTYLNPASVLETVPPPAQLHGAVGVGWSPANDVDASNETAPRPSGEARCDRARKASGQTATGLARFVDYSYCDAILLFLDAARAGGGLTPTAIRQGSATLGSHFAAALTFRAAYSATRMDGSAALRDLAYEDGCSCFRYTSAQLYPP